MRCFSAFVIDSSVSAIAFLTRFFAEVAIFSGLETLIAEAVFFGSSAVLFSEVSMIFPVLVFESSSLGITCKVATDSVFDSFGACISVFQGGGQ